MILRLFPELSGGLHLDRYARVTAIADSPGNGASSERFRPRLAVDIQVLNADMEPDPAFPPYTAVPLPVPMGAGGEAGVFAPPRPGAIVTVGFAYGRQDHPIIKQMYPMGDSLPAVKENEMLLQQSPTVHQRADATGNWSRETDMDIHDKSVTRHVTAMDSETDLARETKTISENSHTEVDGAKTVEVGTQLTMLAGSRADLGTLGEMNLTAGANSTHSTGGTAIETVGGDHTSTVKGNRGIGVDGSRAEKVGGNQQTEIGGKREIKVGANSEEEAVGDKIIRARNILLQAQGTITLTSTKTGEVSLFNELLWALDDIKAALDILATHTHPEVATIVQGGSVQAHSTDLGRHRGIMGNITG